MTLPTQDELNKIADATYAVEEFIISVAKTRNLEVCELGMGVIALLLKRMGDANGTDMTKTIISGMSDAVKKQGEKQ